MLITDLQFQNYVNRHRDKLSNQKIIQIVSEDNDEMLGTYAMIDPQGLVYTNLNGNYSYSQDSILKVGFSNAWAQVEDGFSNEGFNERGGFWSWKKTQSRNLIFLYSEVRLLDKEVIKKYKILIQDVENYVLKKNGRRKLLVSIGLLMTERNGNCDIPNVLCVMNHMMNQIQSLKNILPLFFLEGLKEIVTSLQYVINVINPVIR